MRRPRRCSVASNEAGSIGSVSPPDDADADREADADAAAALARRRREVAKRLHPDRGGDAAAFAAAMAELDAIPKPPAAASPVGSTSGSGSAVRVTLRGRVRRLRRRAARRVSRRRFIEVQPRRPPSAHEPEES